MSKATVKVARRGVTHALVNARGDVVAIGSFSDVDAAEDSPDRKGEITRVIKLTRGARRALRSLRFVMRRDFKLGGEA